MNRKHVVSTILVIIGTALIIVVYFAAYFAMSEKEDGVRQIRCFNETWQAKLFEPAAKVESLITDEEVVTDYGIRLNK